VPFLSPGDLVKWIVDYRVFEAHQDGDIFPVDAVWAFGIIVEVSATEPNSVVLVRLDTQTHEILHMIHDGFIVVSHANGD
tara:strand:+ start:1855 stop:2094 length:240 start_codon:yes stop_codon:yes gene_type:complete